LKIFQKNLPDATQDEQGELKSDIEDLIQPFVVVSA
jgi:hypothetical protein